MGLRLGVTMGLFTDLYFPTRKEGKVENGFCAESGPRLEGKDSPGPRDDGWREGSERDLLYSVQASEERDVRIFQVCKLPL